MRSRNHIDASTLTQLSHQIQDALGEYSQQNKHWHRLFTDPDKIKPQEFMQIVKKNLDDTSLRQRMNDIRAQLVEHCHFIVQMINKVIHHPSYWDVENNVGKVLSTIPQLKHPIVIHTPQQQADVAEFIQQVRLGLNAIDRQALTDKVRLELNEVDERIRAIAEGLDQLETRHNEYFDKYVILLKLLQRFSHNPQLKALLIHELSHLEESQWHHIHGDVPFKIKQALSILDEQRLYNSTEHYLFCKTWDVVGHKNQYPVWTSLLLNQDINKDLDDKYYGKIVCRFRDQFGLVDLANQDMAKFLNASEKAALAKEIEIWSFKNITKFFTKYLCEFSVRHPEADIIAKGLEIKNDLLVPLMKEVERALHLPYINRTVFGKPDEWARIFFDSGKSTRDTLGNVQRIAAQRDILKNSVPELDGVGHVYFVPKASITSMSSRHTTSCLHHALGISASSVKQTVEQKSANVTPGLDSGKQEMIAVVQPLSQEEPASTRRFSLCP